ncbi:MAG TPA: metal-dependent hydrolase [Pyrinomonadaceae bacterium]|nr:metal-dependent hydrolase [Pyrinomonadaceae bacterium]
MDNLTHSLVGLTAAKAGLERLSPGATPLAIIAANAPDVDVAILLTGDRWTYLQHHRGITHAIVGVIALALLLPLLVHGIDRIWSRYRNRPPTTKLRGLMIVSLLVTATHPLLDWTNNYGMRFFLPWSPKWYYGDLVFIVDPYIWLMLGGASFLLTATTIYRKVIWVVLGIVLTVLVLVGSGRAGFPPPFFFRTIWIAGLAALVLMFAFGAARRFGHKLAIIALIFVPLYWSFLAYAHSRAVDAAHFMAQQIVSPRGETVSRLAAMPTLASPLHWECVFESDRATYRFRLRLLSDNFPSSRVVRYEKPSGDLAKALETVSHERPAHVFLGFARFPVAKLADQDCVTHTLVQLADLRYTEPGASRGSFAVELPVECPGSEGGR